MKSAYTGARNAALVLSVLAATWLFFADDLTVSLSAGIAQVSLKHGLGRAFMALLGLICVAFNWESLKLPSEDAAHWQIKVERAAVNIIIVAVVAALAHREFPAWPIWKISLIEGALVTAAGGIAGLFLHVVLWTVQFMRSADEIRRKNLPRIPFAVRAQFNWIFVIIALGLALVGWAQMFSSVQPKWLLYAAFGLGVAFALLVSARGIRKVPRDGMARTFDQHDASYLIFGGSPRTRLAKDHVTSRPEKCLSDSEFEAKRATYSCGVSPNIQGELGWTDTIEAAANGDDRWLDLCLQFGGDVNLDNSLGRTGLFFAACSGHTEVVETLLKEGAAVDFKRPAIDGSPLIGAAREGHVDVVSTLIAAGADLTRRDGRKKSALDYSEELGFGLVAAELRRATLAASRLATDTN